MRSLLSLLLLLLLSPISLAQWNADPALNLPVADGPDTQVQPKIVASPDGGVWISWFEGSGFDVRIQKLDAGGNKVFADEGILVADRSFSSTQDYGLGVDVAGNALLGFRDDRSVDFASGGPSLTVTMVTSAGNQPWGPNGVQLSTPGFLGNIRVSGTTDGGSIVAWGEDGIVHAQKLDANGAEQWVSDTVIPPASGFYFLSDMHTDGNESIISLVNQVSSVRHLHAQKLDSSGAPLWGEDTFEGGQEPIVVFDGGQIQFGNFPSFIPDGNGGAVFSWYDTAGASLQCYVQHILSNGTENFAHNGLAVSTNATRERVAPGSAYDSDSDDIYTFWIELDNNQSSQGIFGQKINSAGTRLWGDEGFELLTPASGAILGPATVLGGPDVFAFWGFAPSTGTDQLYGATVSGEPESAAGGISVFNFDVTTTQSSKSRLSAVNLSGSVDEVALVWSDDRNGNSDVFAQKVDPTGTVPVELTSFESLVDGSTVNLMWETASETSNAGFDVQVQSDQQWTTLGFVDGSGTTTETQQYSFSAELEPGTYTFRLKQIDFDGQFEIVGMLEATVGVVGSHVLSSIYPNPFNPQADFTLAVAEAQHANIELFNLLGQRVATIFDGALESNATQTFAIDGSNLSSGQYILRIRGEHFTDAQRVSLIK